MKLATDETSPSQERDRFLLAERIKYVLNDPISSLMTNMALGLVLCFLFVPFFNTGHLLVWILSLLFISLLRVSIAWFYSKYPDASSAAFWYRLYFTGTIFSAIIWSSTSLFFFPANSFNAQVYLVGILAGLVLGAGHSQAPFRQVHTIYTFIVMGPIILRFFSIGSFYFGTFAFALIFLIAGLLVSTRKMHKILMESLDLRYEMSQMALIDALTGVANRRHFDSFIYQEWRKAQREKWPITMLMVDVDYFKLYNDVYGHQYGDQCLRSIAKEIEKFIHRPSDLVARYGGEEFTVILPNTPLNGALKIAEEIRQAVEKLQIEHKKSIVSQYITVSIGGVVMYPVQDNNFNELVSDADEALYRAKNSGRNRISVYLKDLNDD